MTGNKFATSIFGLCGRAASPVGTSIPCQVTAACSGWLNSNSSCWHSSMSMNTSAWPSVHDSCAEELQSSSRAESSNAIAGTVRSRPVQRQPSAVPQPYAHPAQASWSRLSSPCYSSMDQQPHTTYSNPVGCMNGSCAQQRSYSSAATGGRRSNHHDDDDDDGLNGGAGQQVVRASQVSSAAAQAVMSDPMAMLLSSRGMPLGISLKQGRNNAGDDDSDHSSGGSSSGSSGGHGDGSSSSDSSNSRSSSNMADDEQQDAAAVAASLIKKASPEPGYQMEAIDEIFEVAKAGAAAESAGSKNAGDAWGTTRESPAEIARRIMEIAGDDNSSDATAAAPIEEGENLHLSPDEQRYANLEAMTKDIKGLDEVWEVLASVPWLDEGDLAQKELKGVAMVGLLGTLEEVGFDIRTQLARVWAGERDDAIIVEGVEPRQQAALISIMFHTKQLEDKYGPPPAFMPLGK